MNLDPLRIGIKREEFRANDTNAKQADAVFEAGRDASLRKATFRCVRCGYESREDVKHKKGSVLHVHHLDNNHHNNGPDNLTPHCSLDHAYHHIGCDAPSSGGSPGWASQMRVAFVPELDSEDLNSLQRALGAALSSPEEKEMAMEIINLLGVLAFPVRDSIGSFNAKDFAACFASMDEQDYDQRHEFTEGLRILFHPNILTGVGRDMLMDSPLFPVKSWEGVASGLDLQ